MGSGLCERRATLRTPAVSDHRYARAELSSIRAKRSTNASSSSLKTRPGEPGSKASASTESGRCQQIVLVRTLFLCVSEVC